MKRFALWMIAAMSQPALAQRWEIVSDYDDTVKISSVGGSRLGVVWRALFSERMFPGMAELYGSWHDGPGPWGPSLHFISASPLGLREKIEDDLEEAGFPRALLTLRNWSTQKDSKAFKTAALARYRERADSMILVGDDTQHDPGVYADFAAHGRPLAVYIRHVQGASLRRGQRSFATAFDIAAAEYKAGRLSRNDALAVAEAVLAAPARLLLPGFVACEGLRSSCGTLRRLPEDLAASCRHIEARLQSACQDR